MLVQSRSTSDIANTVGYRPIADPIIGASLILLLTCSDLCMRIVFILIIFAQSIIIVIFTGDAPPIEADESFSSRCDSLQQLLSQQEAVYVAEERALKVMISEQVESELTQQQQQGRLHLTRESK